MKQYIALQNQIIEEYHIDICHGDKCKDDWSRMHAHVKERRICKWVQHNSVQCTFDLLHELGHIETHKSNMRRCESEYSATQWALDKAKELNLSIPDIVVELYQAYINCELDRGKRRGGLDYPKHLELKR